MAGQRTDAEILRRLARVVRLRCLTASEFIREAERAPDLTGRDVPDCVRRLVALVRFRYAGADELGLGRLIDEEADRLERRAAERDGT